MYRVLNITRKRQSAEETEDPNASKTYAASLSVRYVCKMWIMGRVNVLCNQQRKKYVLREQKKKGRHDQND